MCSVISVVVCVNVSRCKFIICKFILYRYVIAGIERHVLLSNMS